MHKKIVLSVTDGGWVEGAVGALGRVIPSTPGCHTISAYGGWQAVDH